MKRIIAAMAAILIICSGSVALAAQTTFSWTPSASADVAGYRLYAKDKATGALTKLGNDIVGASKATATVDTPEPVGLAEYTVVAKAYDLKGNESAPSNEATRDGAVFVWKDVTPPEAPTLLQALRQLTMAIERVASALER